MGVSYQSKLGMQKEGNKEAQCLPKRPNLLHKSRSMLHEEQPMGTGSAGLQGGPGKGEQPGERTFLPWHLPPRDGQARRSNKTPADSLRAGQEGPWLIL